MNLRLKLAIIAAAVALGVLAWWWSGGAGFAWPGGGTLNYSALVNGLASATATAPAIVPPAVVHLPPPESLRALYMTQCAAASPALREHLLGLASTTEINAIVVDLKDYSGTVIFPSATALPDGPGCTYANFESLVKQMHEEGIYVIGRLTAFQDPLYTKHFPEQAVQSLAAAAAGQPAPWRDHKGLSFVDVSSRPFWDYLVALSREAEALGVDEINFDYIRYPSDGNMKDAEYLGADHSRAENLEKFFEFLSSNLKAESRQLFLSADLFGMVTTNYDDLGIGQQLERALPYFDYIAPMVYPSHYPKQFNGWPNPNDQTYNLIKFVLERAVERTVATTTSQAALAYQRIGTTTPAVYEKPSFPASKIRPWLQDFDYPVPYTAAMVRNQIQATYDVGLTSWMLWDPANKYTPAALQP